MPITNTLKNAEAFRRVGFTDEQSSLLADTLEETAHAQSEDLKQFIRQELGNFEARIDAKLDSIRAEIAATRSELRVEIAESRAEFHQALGEMNKTIRDQLLKFLAITVAVLTVAVAIIKLFPNVG